MARTRYIVTKDGDLVEDTGPRNRVPNRVPGTPMRAFARPIEMYSVAPNSPGEARQLREAGVELTPDTLVPIAHTRQEKMKILEVTGCEERN